MIICRWSGPPNPFLCRDIYFWIVLISMIVLDELLIWKFKYQLNFFWSARFLEAVTFFVKCSAEGMSRWYSIFSQCIKLRLAWPIQSRADKLILKVWWWWQENINLKPTSFTHHYQRLRDMHLSHYTKETGLVFSLVFVTFDYFLKILKYF